LNSSADRVGEFDLIRRYFSRPGQRARLGVGDDCALFDVRGTLAISTDALIAGRHFFPEVDPNALGHKALAVNLSDLAAMGAQPLAFTLTLGLPTAQAQNPDWMQAFSNGLYALAQRYDCELIGGDTCASPVVLIAITIMGQVAPDLALCRSKARVGDDIYVSGCLGDAALALTQLQAGQPVAETLRQRLERPEPRVALGRALVGIAHAAIDLSDGLAGDLQHVLRASAHATGHDLGASIELEQLPVSEHFAAASHELSQRQKWHYQLAGGDDYELCFIAPASRREQVAQAAALAGVDVRRIGRIEHETGLRWHEHGQPVMLELQSFDHFTDASLSHRST
jgi:thiamine-monophosphate kinase